jgi:hypothetical protein
MSRILAVARLTFREAIRMRIVIVFVVLLLFLMVLLPFTLRGDDTLAGRLRNFLDYALASVSVFLTLATIFLSCATLSNELRERTLHLVVTKPITRFQILIGKWLGVNLLNLLMLALCGGAIYGFAYFIRKLPEQFERDRTQIEDVVWTARAAGRPETPDFRALAAQIVEQRIKDGSLRPELRAEAETEQQKELQAGWRTIKPSYFSVYEFKDLPLPDSPATIMQVRFKARAVPTPFDEQVRVQWVFLDPDSGEPLHDPIQTSERSGDTHQFLVRAAVLKPDEHMRTGRAALWVGNPTPTDKSTRVFFEGDDSLQLLYRVGSFEANYAKALLIILLRLSIISALGVFFSIFVSFPVACLCMCAFSLICYSMSFVLESIGANETVWDPKYDPYGHIGPAVRSALVPFLKFFFPNFNYYNGAALLVDGEYIGYPVLAWCLLHTLVYGAVMLLLIGWMIFQRREVAEVIV